MSESDIRWVLAYEERERERTEDREVYLLLYDLPFD